MIQLTLASVVRQLKRIISITLFLITAVGAMFWVLNRGFLLSQRQICNLVSTKIYLEDPFYLSDWKNLCTADLPFYSKISRNSFLSIMNDRLRALGTSHLYLYDPSENRATWENSDLENGLRVREADGKFFVYRIVKGAPAEGRFQIGDQILLLGSNSPSSDQEIADYSGTILVDRAGAKVSIETEIGDVNDDLSISFSDLDGTGLLRIPSFLPQYFDRDQWKTVFNNLKATKRLVIDLRQNRGGSFPAMMKALSSFVCQEIEVGRLITNSALPRREVYLKSDLAAKSQLAQLEQSSEIKLKTFSSECFKGSMRVLIDDQTGSVAEVFADALRQHKKVQIFGMSSQGRVVLARWFSLPSLGIQDFSISIPIAGYKNSNSESLEGQGVLVEKETSYSASDLQRGLDTIFKKASADW